MNSYNFIRSLNLLSCTNSVLNKKATHLKQPLLQYTNFCHSRSFDSEILFKSTQSNNYSPISILCWHHIRHSKSNYRQLHSIALSIGMIGQKEHRLTDVAKNFLLQNHHKNFSNDIKDTTPNTQLTRKEKLKRAVKEYGSTVIIFHVTISLMSLGGCYLLVSSGIDLAKIFSSLGISGSVATNAGTFVTAYAIHKVFAPVRISITLGATPFIVRYLRRIGFLKAPKNP
ncbi:hypothetical protein RN001_007464 [Aquatica leii]|uniref:DUF1279 domain-containing protein n=1 Tax=Aquatica leii TaxID=1421715 RepID=A0AAN7QIB8_9COLE|nr:hypothetical protein RN001_007464 [Aquatica leii]